MTITATRPTPLAQLPQPAPTATTPRRRRLLPPGWPVAALFVGYPLWWALGLSWAVYPVVAIPMAMHLLRRRRIVFPTGFGLWIAFLLWSLAGVLALGAQVPGTDEGSYFGRSVAFTHRFGIYLSATILLLYLCNMGDQLPVRRVVRMLGFLFIATVVGGLLGIAFPRGEFTSLAEILLPRSITAEPFVQELVHPNFSQVQGVLGYSSPRPAAPFAYTNQWGAAFSFLLPFFVVAWFAHGGRWRRRLAPLVLAISVIPAIYSLNRGLWVGVGFSVVFFACWLATRGRLWALQGLITALAVLALIFAFTPLNGIVNERLANPHSNDSRFYLAEQALQGALQSPLLGWGGPRPSSGSDKSITAGPSSQCPECGAPSIGTHGTIYFLIFSNGFVGAGLFIGFFVVVLLRRIRDPDPVAVAATLVICLVLLEMTYYNLVPMPLHIAMAGIALAWRNRREADTRSAAEVRAP